jgi:hypothetical protein
LTGWCRRPGSSSLILVAILVHPIVVNISVLVPLLLRIVRLLTPRSRIADRAVVWVMTLPLTRATALARILTTAILFGLRGTVAIVHLKPPDQLWSKSDALRALSERRSLWY